MADKNGTYELKFSYVGVTSKKRSIDTRNQHTFTNDIVLEPLQELEEVSVVAQKQVIEHHADRI